MPDVRPKLEQGITPRGIAKYPRVDGTPDVKFSKDGFGVWKISLVLGTAAAAPLISKIDTAMGKSFADAKADPANKKTKIKMSDPPYKAVIDDAGNETGDIQFSFKMKAGGISQSGPKKGQPWSMKPGLFDAKMNPLKSAKVGGGSEVKVAYEIMPFYTALVGAGVSLRLRAVQILKLVPYGDRDAAGYGFGEEEGYEGSDPPAAEETPDRSGEEEGAAADANAERDF